MSTSTDDWPRNIDLLEAILTSAGRPGAILTSAGRPGAILTSAGRPGAILTSASLASTDSWKADRLGID